MLRLVMDRRGRLRPANKAPSGAQALVSLVLGFVLVGALASWWTSPSRSPDPADQARLAETVDAERAWRYCQDAVRARLKAPSTARFPGREAVDGLVVKGSDGTVAYQVVSYVDAQNSFGAMIRTQFECVARKLPDGRWEVSSVSFRGDG